MKRKNHHRIRFPGYVFLSVVCLACFACSHVQSRKTVAVQTPEASNWVIDFYRGPLNHLSAVRHGECPMHPSCSEYGRQAIEKFGVIKGWMMIFDRLMRCGRDELKTADRILVNGKLKFYDPVEFGDCDLTSDIQESKWKINRPETGM